jgi:serine/threonine protein kinase
MHDVAKVAHRDIKPENIILTDSPMDVHIKISDFGLAKIVNTSAMSRGMIGTLAYMAPEMFLGGLYDIFAADVWSMGIVCLDVLCFWRFVHREVIENPTPANAKENKSKEEHETSLMHAATAYSPRSSKYQSALHRFFGPYDTSDQLLQKHLRQELQSMKGEFGILLAGTLRLSSSQRWSAKEMLEVCPVDVDEAYEEPSSPWPPTFPLNSTLRKSTAR